MFLENESEVCECKVNVFSADKVMTTCLVLHTDYHIFMRMFFSSIIDASVNLVRGFPLRVKKKKKNAESMDRSWKFQDIVSQKLEWTWLFMWLHYLGIFT